MTQKEIVNDYKIKHAICQKAEIKLYRHFKRKIKNVKTVVMLNKMKEDLEIIPESVGKTVILKLILLKKIEFVKELRFYEK